MHQNIKICINVCIHIHLCNIIIHKFIYAIYLQYCIYAETFLWDIFDTYMRYIYEHLCYNVCMIHLLLYNYNIVMGSKYETKKVIWIQNVFLSFFGAVHCHDLEVWRWATFAALFRFWMLAYIHICLFFYRFCMIWLL